MMDIQELREEFEKLPEISEKLKRAQWAEKYQQYLAKDIYCKEKDLHFLDGAWCAFQEQQKKINEIKAIAESWINQDYTHNSDSTDIKIQQMKDCGRDIIRKINGE